LKEAAVSAIVWQLSTDVYRQKDWTETPAAIIDWIRTHDIDPNVVSLNYPVTVEVHDDRQYICYREVVLDEHGNSRLDETGNQIVTVERRVPLTAAPPNLDSL